MKKLKNPYQVFDNYILRIPLLNYQFYKNLHLNDPITEEDFLSVFKNPIINEALYLASPELHNQLEKWCHGYLDDTSKVFRLQDSLLKYVSRMTSRCTPFGLFASCCIGGFSKDTYIEVRSSETFKRITRFDMTFLSALSKSLANNSIIKSQLLFFPNTSLYKIGSQYRYAEYKIDQDRRTYTLEGLTYSEAIETTLKSAATGKTISRLCHELVSEDISIEDAKGFINQLIDLQILVSELEIPITTYDVLDYFIEIIRLMKDVTEPLHRLEKLSSSLKDIDSKLPQSYELYKSLSQEVSEYSLSFNSKYLFQIDLFSNTKSNTLEYNYKRILKDALVVLNKISNSSYLNKNLVDFKSTFTKRYEDAEIPLTQALDVETGIGYNVERGDNTPVVDDLFFPSKSANHQTIKWSKFDDILLNKINHVIAEKSMSLTLNDVDFENFNAQWHDLPSTMSSLIQIVQIKNDQKIIISGIGGSSAANLLARFGHGNSEINSYIKKIIETEQVINKDAILAEIVHLPQDRTGNILQRPAFRAFEIPYLGNSLLPKTQQIDINDLMVSVKHDKIILRSLKHNKEVIPRLTNAHNYSYDALPIYHFLCDLQTQKQRPSIQFSWNAVFQKYKFLPRVEYKNFVFSKARWLIKKNDIAILLENISEPNKIHVENWKHQLNLPRYVELVEGDNTLLVDLSNMRAIQMLLRTVKTKKTFILQEFLLGKGELVKRTEEVLCNEFVVSFYNEAKLKESNNG